MSEWNEKGWSNEVLAFEVIRACWQAGCREFVLCSGSRNSPLVLELLRLEQEDQRGELKIWNFFEERAAAFFALGRAKISGLPTAVVTTSGTAAAELLPAVIEAHYSGLPLLLVTADRPPHFRRSGAPQAIDQENLYGENVNLFLDVSAHHYSDLEDLPDFLLERESAVRWHINVAFEEPLVAGDEGGGGSLQGLEKIDPADERYDDWEMVEDFIDKSGDVVVLIGCLSPSERSAELVQALAELALPIWLDAGSGLRESNILYPLVIKDEQKFFTHFSNKGNGRVLRLGGVPSLRFWRDLESLDDIEVLSLAPAGEFSGLGRISAVAMEDVTAGLRLLAEALGGNETRDEVKGTGRLDVLLEKYPQSEPAWMRKLSQGIPVGSQVYLGNSMPIREWNLAATFEDRALSCFASRGANGIDGQVSTYFGLSADAKESWGVFGDLTALYDLSAPWVLNQLGEGKRRLVVINNGGGRIFSRLPHLARLDESQKQVTENRHQIDFKHWAAMWSMDYLRVVTADGWKAEQIEGKETLVIELCPDLEQTEAFWRDYVKEDS
ncbi:MAG: 2-succinyl-5-enolpyruvyl-6-hydroxy-3-cyclohexene-1-carboxylic-acid synthase [Verrucomicrobiota bacterium]